MSPLECWGAGPLMETWGGRLMLEEGTVGLRLGKALAEPAMKIENGLGAYLSPHHQRGGNAPQ